MDVTRRETNRQVPLALTRRCDLGRRLPDEVAARCRDLIAQLLEAIVVGERAGGPGDE
jgi:hypothetical protein